MSNSKACFDDEGRHICDPGKGCDIRTGKCIMITKAGKPRKSKNLPESSYYDASSGLIGDDEEEVLKIIKEYKKKYGKSLKPQESSSKKSSPKEEKTPKKTPKKSSTKEEKTPKKTPKKSSPKEEKTPKRSSKKTPKKSFPKEEKTPKRSSKKTPKKRVSEDDIPIRSRSPSPVKRKSKKNVISDTPKSPAKKRTKKTKLVFSPNTKSKLCLTPDGRPKCPPDTACNTETGECLHIRTKGDRKGEVKGQKKLRAKLKDEYFMKDGYVGRKEDVLRYLATVKKLEKSLTPLTTSPRSPKSESPYSRMREETELKTSSTRSSSPGSPYTKMRREIERGLESGKYTAKPKTAKKAKAFKCWDPRHPDCPEGSVCSAASGKCEDWETARGTGSYVVFETDSGRQIVGKREQIDKISKHISGKIVETVASPKAKKTPKKRASELVSPKAKKTPKKKSSPKRSPSPKESPRESPKRASPRESPKKALGADKSKELRESFMRCLDLVASA